MGRYVGIVALLCALVGWAGPAGATAKPPKNAILFSDSLGWESFYPAQATLGTKWNLVNRSVLGGAPCDWLPTLQASLDQYKPAVVTMATAGNTRGPESCETAAAGSAQFFTDYQEDLATFVQTVSASGAQLVFIEDPPFLDATRNAARPQINADMVALANEYPRVTIVTGVAKSLAGPKGAYTAYKKCLKSETAAMGCSDGMIAIRTVTGGGVGLHFCPDGLIGAHCDEYSSGELRFGRAIARSSKNPRPVIP